MIDMPTVLSNTRAHAALCSTNQLDQVSRSRKRCVADQLGKRLRGIYAVSAFCFGSVSTLCFYSIASWDCPGDLAGSYA